MSTDVFRFFDLHVVRRTEVSPSVTRVSLGGDPIEEFVGGGRDQSFSLILPHPGQDAPVVPTGEDWYTRWRAMDPGVRGVLRSYTIRAHRPGPGGELDIDFALHGDGGPASRWAASARPGDRVKIIGPVVEDNSGVRFRPPAGTDWVLIAADETALPAADGILAWLPAGTRAKVFIEVPHAGDFRELTTAADAEITWLVRDPAAASHGTGLIEAVRAAGLPAGTPYAWIAGESGTVRALRRHLVGERRLDRRAVTFVGYWRKGASEDHLRAEAGAGTGAGADD
ncbi:siderophore-interacting protein [Streptomyces sp. NPDC001070]